MPDMTALQVLETLYNYSIDEWNEGTPRRKALDEAYELLRAALTPPTAEEVCEEIERYFYQCVGKANPYIKYIKDLKQFVYVDGDKYYEVVVLDKNWYISFKTSLPSYLIELIGRFYGNNK